MQQGGAALTIGGSVADGVILSAAPINPSTTDPDVDKNGVPDALQGTANVVSFGAAPAMQIGGASAISFGAYTAANYISPNNTSPPPKTFGLVVQGSVSGFGLFDPLTTPFLPGVVSATGLQIGGQILVTPAIDVFNSSNVYQSTTPAVWAASGAVNIAGGLYNSGSISAQAYQADATAIHIGADPLSGHCNPCALVTLPTIYNDGQIVASSIQVNSATTSTNNGSGLPATPAPVAVNVTAILIEKDANVTSITNNSGILAELSGTGGVGGSTTAILDKSGTLQSVTNTGSIDAFLNQTLATTPMPLDGADGSSNTVAIDMSAGTAAQTISQSVLAPGRHQHRLCRDPELYGRAGRHLQRQYLREYRGRLGGQRSHHHPCRLARDRRGHPLHRRRYLLRLGERHPQHLRRHGQLPDHQDGRRAQHHQRPESSTPRMG